ncbi:MAG TPA: UDP-N-acetylglucosamine--N-acetylmuramyl-(pentapeptide) pyrophosphoryl-undecaprenol N-acetylglucosamine transferase [Candidatus Moranbacteria bacterium]|nr:UDP-N-acetylglucosamine--N-acetylmuramyl-(pentapeptide) pyrophosphoryl-undecaprenol N-acetylglucosamine transferase [Candidatus Moranbacteria bacterium]
MALRIALTGGGSGGHLFPLIQVAKKIKEQEPQAEFLFLGPKTDMEREIIEGAGISQRKVLSGKLYRYFTWGYLLNFVKIPLGLIQSLWHLLWYMPDAVFAKGGYASVPVVIAARIYAIPVLVHESDAQPGLANRFLGSIATKVALTFDRAKIHFPPTKTIVTGGPINPNVLGGDPEAGRNWLKIKKDKPVLLILGGSQGAQIINKRIISFLPELIKRFQVVHQTGRNNFEEIKNLAQKQGYKVGHSDYHPVSFFGEEIKHIFALADVVISRSGATSIAEIAANKKPAILVPILHSANNHQRINAFEASRLGAAIVIEETNFKKNLVLTQLDQITNNTELKERLEKNIQKLYYPLAADKLAENILAIIK